MIWKLSEKVTKQKKKLDKFDKTSKFGDVNHGPRKLCFFSITTVQNDVLTNETDVDDKMDALTEYPF